MKAIKTIKSIGKSTHHDQKNHAKPCLLFAIMALLMLLNVLTGCQQKQNRGAQLLQQAFETLNKQDLLASYQYTIQAIDATNPKTDYGTYLEAQTFLGLLYRTMGQHEEAFEIFKSLPSDSARGRRQRVFLLSLTCMAYYTATIDKDYQKAISYGKRILSLEKDEKDLNLLYTDQLNLAEVYVMMGDTMNAQQLINQVDTTKIPSRAIQCKMQLLLVKAEISMLQKNYSEAYRYAQQLLAMNNSYENINNSTDALNIIIKIDSLDRNFDSYIYYRNRMDTIREKAQGEQIKYKIQLTEQQYKIENMRMSVAKKRQLYNGGIVFLVVVAAMLAFISYIQYRKAKMQKRINEMERGQLDADIQRKRLENELLTLKMQKAKEELTQAYQDNVNMSMMLDESPDSNSYASRLDYLEALLKRQYGDFMKRLSRQYPRLSYNETLIIGFTRMKLSAKDISTALGISPESLSKAKYRLRKKLGLDSVEELDALIAEI